MNTAVEQLMLIGGTALLYSTEGLADQRQAAFDSILYAQLVANKNAGPRFGDTAQWYAAYKEAYRQLGWIKLASTHDVKQLGQPVRSGPIQPLEAWLRMRSIPHDAVLGAVKAGLSRSAAGFAHLLSFTTQDQPQGSKLVIELGMLKPGPVLDLCSASMHLDLSLSSIPEGTLLRDLVLQGEAEFNGVSLALDNGRFQRQRDELQALMKAKDAQGEYRFDPCAPVRGGHDE